MSMWVIGISTVVSLAGTAVSVYAQNQAADAAETTAMLNANEQKKQANREAEVAAENARRAEREKTRYLASQRAQLAASGLAMEGTPIAVLGDTAQALELQILDMGSEAANRMRALRQGAALSVYEGQATASSLRTQSIATGLSGTSSAIMSGAKAGGFLAPSSEK
jgi:hypothetical protein